MCMFFCENGKFLANVYRGKNFNVVYTNFSSFIALEHKLGLGYILLDCCFCLVFDMSKFHLEIEKLKEILYLIDILKLSNRYSKNLLINAF